MELVFPVSVALTLAPSARRNLKQKSESAKFLATIRRELSPCGQTLVPGYRVSTLSQRLVIIYSPVHRPASVC